MGIDAQGNEIRQVGNVTEILIPGPALQAEMDAQRAAAVALQAKVEANKIALDALAIDARNFAKGSAVLTLAQLTTACRRLAEMQARMWFNERFDDS